MLVTRPTHRGSGIALLVETSNAEAHADMYINEYDANNRQGLPAYNQSDITYPWTSTVALNLTNNSKLPDFYVSRTKRQVNAFILCRDTFIPLTFSPILAQESRLKRLQMPRHGVSECGIGCKGNEKNDYSRIFS